MDANEIISGYFRDNCKLPLGQWFSAKYAIPIDLSLKLCAIHDSFAYDAIVKYIA